jgi:hypothetical protein
MAKKIADMEEVFSAGEIRRLKRWIACYRNPLLPAVVVAAACLIALIALIIVAVYFEIEAPQGGVASEIFVVSAVAGLVSFILTKPIATRVFAQFDQEYFQRAKVSEEDLVAALVEDTRREAAIHFTEAPDGSNITVSRFPKEQQAAAYKAFEADFLKQQASEEQRLQFKAYVARAFGLRIPFKKARFSTRLFDAIFGKKMTIQVPQKDGTVRDVRVTKAWYEKMLADGKMSVAPKNTVHVHIIGPYGLRRDSLVVGVDIPAERYERLVDPQTGSLYAIEVFEAGEPSMTIVPRAIWEEAKRQLA